MNLRSRFLRMLVALLALVVVAHFIVPEKRRVDAAAPAVAGPDCSPANYSGVFFKKNSKASSSTVTAWLTRGAAVRARRALEAAAFDPRWRRARAARYLLVVSLRSPLNRTVSHFYSSLPGNTVHRRVRARARGLARARARVALWLDAWAATSAGGNASSAASSSRGALTPARLIRPSYYVRLLSARCARGGGGGVGGGGGRPRASVGACRRGCAPRERAPVGAARLGRPRAARAALRRRLHGGSTTPRGWRAARRPRPAAPSLAAFAGGAPPATRCARALGRPPARRDAHLPARERARRRRAAAAGHRGAAARRARSTRAAIGARGRAGAHRAAAATKAGLPRGRVGSGGRPTATRRADGRRPSSSAAWPACHRSRVARRRRPRRCRCARHRVALHVELEHFSQ